MLCQKCGEEIDTVFVVSECWQRAVLDGNTIADYYGFPEVDGLIRYECPECNREIENIE